MQYYFRKNEYSKKLTNIFAKIVYNYKKMDYNINTYNFIRKKYIP